MKQIFYFILIIAGFSSIHSCKSLLDEEGNPLLDLNNTGGLSGPRALYREITDKDTIAEYFYSGLLVNKVITDSASVTDIMYSGDKISQINFNGFLDLDGNGKLDKDSVSYTQLFTYTNNNKIDKISENRSIFRRPPPVPPATTPGPQTLFRKEKILYNVYYNASTAKLDSIIMRNGPDAAGTTFAFTAYSRTKYTYVGDNVSKVIRYYGPIGAGDVFGAPNRKYSYEYYAYDDQISPFTLLPHAYKLSRLLSTVINDKESLILSPNNPKRWSVTDLTPPIPTPIVKSTNYVYDPQTYMTKGYGINYIYKPQ
ncbi:hypothetical protein H3Z85_09035 [Chryseobacterium indologenes]|uniref:hypothetical protein n=1 Tax=Chryseobacterium indologenes TaxID=253 RepID=UPI0003E081D9|nr:hypothetical protein [Chryseobacterium indologenes]QPQ53447.1 hypothetical protein H3Z85_09035 [Chryseobacterium indologenes]GAE63774.1 hypothetical protein CIN01S_04_03810 [Chryseobacterium indologenes NBRC 14944]SFJ57668.1 hypothetical protein SAMN05421692_2025 [Chryseobacterium indologenes]SUX52308.1 Uncharacterised protein [Chryseobacterium indologenes]